ncbi:hypothetical protein CVS40_7780 [Lucilia cuprina]|nr:hypothetical protein CVS40_7780 [Lucilia cuprina]
MLNLQIVFLICCVTYTQAFSCEWDCPLNAECAGQDICRCKNGYKTIISEEDGLPHCELKYEPTMSEISTTSKEDLKTEEVDNMDGLEFADYSYMQDIALSTELFDAEQETEENFNEELQTEILINENSTESAYTTEVTDDNYFNYKGESTKDFQRYLPEFTNFEEYNNSSEKEVDKSLSVTLPAQTDNPLSEANTKLSEEQQLFTTLKPLIRLNVSEEETFHGQTKSLFYTILGILSMFLAFLYIISVMFGCFKI